MQLLFFALGMLVLLLADLLLVHKKGKELSIHKSLCIMTFWIALGVALGGFVWSSRGAEAGLQYYASYFIEFALSIDNLLLFSVIFSYFHIPPTGQQRLLFLGILSAFILRGLFIFLGLALIEQFHFLFYLFGIFLCWVGVRLFFSSSMRRKYSPEKGLLYRLFGSFLPIAHQVTDTLFVKRRGRWHLTALFLALLSLESVDLLFAMDSIPATFAVTTDPFIAYTANMSALLGLRSLHAIVRHLLGRFPYLEKGIAVLLLLAGAKMLTREWLVLPQGATLTLFVLTIGISLAIRNPDCKK